MPDHRETIDKALTEHRDIRDTPKLTAASVTDVEALFALRQVFTGWSQCAPEDLAAKQDQLLQTLNIIDRGLKGHWSHEEKAMENIFGEPLMKGFLYEHREIATRIGKARVALTGARPAGKDHQELLSRKTVIQDAVNPVLQAIEEHSNHEDMIFKMIKKGLENPPK